MSLVELVLTSGRRTATRTLGVKFRAKSIPMGKGGFCSFRLLFLWCVYYLIIIVWVRFFMNELRIFENPQFGKVRTAGTTDNPLFCLADVCNALGLQQGHVRERLDKGGRFNRTPCNGRRCTKCELCK